MFNNYLDSLLSDKMSFIGLTLVGFLLTYPRKKVEEVTQKDTHTDKEENQSKTFLKLRWNKINWWE